MSNEKIERWHATLTGECIRVKTSLSLDDAQQDVTENMAHGIEFTGTAPRSALSRRRTDWKARADLRRPAAEGGEKAEGTAPGRRPPVADSPVAAGL